MTMELNVTLYNTNFKVRSQYVNKYVLFSCFMIYYTCSDIQHHVMFLIQFDECIYTNFYVGEPVHVLDIVRFMWKKHFINIWTMKTNEDTIKVRSRITTIIHVECNLDTSDITYIF